MYGPSVVRSAKEGEFPPKKFKIPRAAYSAVVTYPSFVALWLLRRAKEGDYEGWISPWSFIVSPFPALKTIIVYLELDN